MSRTNSGFTLIELLIVIAIIGVLAAVVLVGIDPVDKIAAANDAKVQRDINALAAALEQHAINNGVYTIPGNSTQIQDTLIAEGALKARLKPPSGYACYTSGPSSYHIDINFPSAGETRVLCEMKSKKYTSQGDYWWVWCASSGRAGGIIITQNCP